jgi:hypothetical protein
MTFRDGKVVNGTAFYDSVAFNELWDSVQPANSRAKTGYAKAAMSIHLTPQGGATRVDVETRVAATSPDARRAFAPYWLLIRLGGAGFIRLELLRSLARIAERRSGS